MKSKPLMTQALRDRAAGLALAYRILDDERRAFQAELRTAVGDEQPKALAAALGINPRHLSHISHGLRAPTLRLAQGLLRVLNSKGESA